MNSKTAMRRFASSRSKETSSFADWALYELTLYVKALKK